MNTSTNVKFLAFQGIVRTWRRLMGLWFPYSTQTASPRFVLAIVFNFHYIDLPRGQYWENKQRLARAPRPSVILLALRCWNSGPCVIMTLYLSNRLSAPSDSARVDRTRWFFFSAWMDIGVPLNQTSSSRWTQTSSTASRTLGGENKRISTSEWH